MTAVIENIERDVFRQVTPKNIGNIENIKIERRGSFEKMFLCKTVRASL